MAGAAEAPDVHAMLLDVLDEGVGLLDADGVVVRANRALAGMVGHAPGWLVGAPLRPRIPEGERESWDAAFVAALFFDDAAL